MRSTWRTVKLKYLAAEPIRNGLGEAAQYDDADWPRYIRTTDIAGPRSLRPETFASLPDQTARLADVKRGDLLMSAAGTVGRTLLYESDQPACFAGYLVRLRPGPAVNPGFLSYWSETSLFQDQVEMGKVRSTIDNFSAGKYQNVEIRLPEPAHQLAIARYLDAETARIDALIAKKVRLDHVLEERQGGLLQYALMQFGIDLHESIASRARALPESWRISCLGRVVKQLTNGYVGPTRDILVEEGVQYIQGMHIKSGKIDFARRPFYVTEEWYRARPRIALAHGDVLIVQTGDIGQVAVVPDDLGPASCHALLIARPDPDLICSDYLGIYLQSPTGRHELLRLATGALHPHLEFGIKAAPVLVPPLGVQKQLVERVRARTATIESTRDRLDRQIRLLKEHRRALITAAVSGELEISGAV